MKFIILNDLIHQVKPIYRFITRLMGFTQFDDYDKQLRFFKYRIEIFYQHNNKIKKIIWPIPNLVKAADLIAVQQSATDTLYWDGKTQQICAKQAD